MMILSSAPAFVYLSHLCRTALILLFHADFHVIDEINTETHIDISGFIARLVRIK